MPTNLVATDLPSPQTYPGEHQHPFWLAMEERHANSFTRRRLAAAEHQGRDSPFSGSNKVPQVPTLPEDTLVGCQPKHTTFCCLRVSFDLTELNKITSWFATSSSRLCPPHVLWNYEFNTFCFHGLVVCKKVLPIHKASLPKHIRFFFILVDKAIGGFRLTRHLCNVGYCLTPSE